jgi:hypothetical protein
MTSIADSSVTIQTSARSVPATPTWFGEVALLVHHLRQQGILSAISERVRFARRRFGCYEVIDLVAVLLGYAISGERTRETFYARLHPFAGAFMALFGRDRLPARSTLSRFLTGLPAEPVESLRALFLADLLARPLAQEGPLGGLWDRAGTRLSRLCCGWDARSRPATRLASDPGSAGRPTPLTPALCPGVPGAQARGGRAHAHHHLAGPYPPVAQHLRPPRQRRVPGRIAARARGPSGLPEGALPPTSTRRGAPGWAIWHGSRPGGSGRLVVRDPREGLYRVGAARGPDPLAPAGRSAVHPPGT